jgi:xanthine dehydrogenase accessory factor
MNEVIRRAHELDASGDAYALATVVRVDRPVSAKPGDRALVTPDGRLMGWVGGSCSEPIVIREALASLADGSARLVQIRPPGATVERDRAGVVVEVTTCESEGGMDVFVEPRRSSPRVVVVGSSPVARKVAQLAAAVGYRVEAALDSPAEHVPDAHIHLTMKELATRELGSQDAVVVATMNRYDESGLRAALATGAGYVGLVASRPRATKMMELLRSRSIDARALERIHSPAGLDLGPSTQEEIAVAILAEMVAERHRSSSQPTELFCEPVAAEAIDPVCGMSVAVTAQAISAEHDGVTYYFCGPGCRDAFLDDVERFATSAGAGRAI